MTTFIIELRCPVCGKLHAWRGARFIRRCEDCRAKLRQKAEEMVRDSVARRGSSEV